MKRWAVLFVTTTYLGLASQPGTTAQDERVIGEDRNSLLAARLQSDEGTFVVYDAAVPWTERDARARYVGWWLGAGDPQVYVYPQLLFSPREAVGALIDLGDQFGVDLSQLTADEPAMLKLLVRELEQREAVRAGERPIRTATVGERSETDPPEFPLIEGGGAGTMWIPATRDTVLALMGFRPAPDSRTGLIGDDVFFSSFECIPDEHVVGRARPRHRGPLSVLRAILDVMSSLCPGGGGGGGGCTCCYGILPGAVAVTADGSETAVVNCCGAGCNDGDPCTLSDN